MNPSTAEPIVSTLADDPDLADIVEMFVDEMPGRTKEFSSHCGAGNWEGLRRAAHQLKGAAGSYGFAPIGAAAGQLEAAIRGEEPEETIRREVQALIDLCNRATAGTG